MVRPGLVLLVVLCGFQDRIGCRAATGDILWSHDVGAPIFASPTIGRDGTIYIGSNASTCTALIPTSDQPIVKWTYAADDWIDATAAVGEDGTLYVGTYNSTLAALEPEGGAARWEITLGEQDGLFGVVQGSPAITADGLIVVSTSAGVIYGILPTGEELWSYEFAADIRSSPAIDGEGRIYFGADDGNVRCLNERGELQWSFAVEGAGEDASRIYGSPAIDGDGNIYVGAGNGKLYSLDRDGGLRWKFETPEAVDASPAIDGENRIYFASRNGSVYCVDQAGAECWSKFLGDIFYSSPVIDANGFVYITYFGGGGISYVVAFAPGGEEVWETPIEAIIDSSPVLTPDGHLLVGAFDGRLYAIESGGALDYTVPWARFRRDTRGRGRVVEGALPEIVTGLSPVALPQNGVGRLRLGEVVGGEAFSWRRGGEFIALTGESFLTVGPVTVAHVARYDVIVSNAVGEIWVPPTLLIQVGEPQWNLAGEPDALTMAYTHPLSSGFRVEESDNLVSWKDSLVVESEKLDSVDWQTTTVSLSDPGGKGFVRFVWEP